MVYSFEKVLQILQIIEDIGFDPNKWELQFLKSIKENRKDLSVKQTVCLNNIYNKAVGKVVL